MKRQFFRIFDPILYGLQWCPLYFFQGFTAWTALTVLYIGCLVVTASWLIAIFGEERTVTFITNHPYLFMCCVLVFTACTGGVGYWCYSRDTDDLHAAYRSRLAKHSQLFKVA